MSARGLDKPEDRITVTKPDAPIMRQKDGSFAPGVNAQAVTDLDSGAVVHAQVVDGGGDGGQLGPQIEQTRKTLTELGLGPHGGGVRAPPHDAGPLGGLRGGVRPDEQPAALEEVPHVGQRRGAGGTAVAPTHTHPHAADRNLETTGTAGPNTIGAGKGGPKSRTGRMQTGAAHQKTARTGRIRE